MKIFYFILTGIVVLIGITFSVLNAEQVTVNYYFGHYKLPLSMLLLLSISFGLLLGFCTSLIKIIKLRSKNYCLKNKLKVFEKEVENLRAIPLKDEH